MEENNAEWRRRETELVLKKHSAGKLCLASLAVTGPGRVTKEHIMLDECEVTLVRARQEQGKRASGGVGWGIWFDEEKIRRLESVAVARGGMGWGWGWDGEKSTSEVRARGGRKRRGAKYHVHACLDQAIST